MSTDDCGCCEGTAEQTPAESANRPGLSEITYRVGTHEQFKQSMLARLSGDSALSKLSTRDDSDFSIALLDAWATVAHVLAFYQERIANESYLRTATERVSLLHLARLIGYELRPGVAANATLAFTLEAAPGALRKAIIDTGVKVQSIPGPDELPQTFETIERIEARPEWNALRPRQTELKGPAGKHAFFKGVATALAPGDGLLFIGSAQFRRVVAVTPNPAAGITRVEWDRALESTGPVSQVYALRQRAGIFGSNAPDWKGLPDLIKASHLGLASADQVLAAEKEEWPFFTILAPTSTRAAPAPEASARRPGFLPTEDAIDLDGVYSRITPGSWLALVLPTDEEIYQVAKVAEVTRTDFGVTSKVTRVTLSAKPSKLEGTTPKLSSGASWVADLKQKFGGKVRETTVYAESDLLELAPEPLTAAVSGDGILLDGRVKGLVAGQLLAVFGVEHETDEPVSEMATLRQIQTTSNGTMLVFDRPLKHSYQRAAMTLNANVARATHGETVQEVLGSGDASRAFQRFTLRQAPVTFVSAPPSGAESTLQVRVDELLWHEVPTLYGRGPRDRVYVTRRTDEGKTVVQFGDGITGARLPTGLENVRATYRKGIGLVGQVDAGQLSLLMTRPLGVNSVTNPEAAAGADDPESRDDARRNANLTVLALDRTVSLQDYEDFARAYPGVAKAVTVWAWNGQTRAVQVTVAGPGGAAIAEGTALHDSLVSALRQSGDPYVRLQVQSYTPAFFHIAASVKVDPDFRPELVLAAVKESLRSRFSFAAREFGQSVTLGEVMAAIHAVPGVVAVDVDQLYRAPLAPGSPELNPRLLVAAAELLVLEAGPLSGVRVQS